jgi:hypothetical protein
LFQNGRVLNRLDQPQAKRLQRDAERQVAVPILGFEIRGGKIRGRASGRADVGSSDDREQLVHATIGRYQCLSRQMRLSFTAALSTYKN